jgi:hypothetical protein
VCLHWSCAATALYYGFINDASINLLLPINLLGRQFPLSSGVHQELVFLIEDVAKLESMIDQIFVCIGGVIYRYTSKTREKIAGFNTYEAVNTDIADVRGVTVDLISDVAMLFNVLATGTTIKFFADFDPNERPFSFRCVEIGCH